MQTRIAASAAHPISRADQGTAYADAMERLQRYGPSLADGLFSHAPMVVDALVELAAPDHIAAWIEAQRDGFTSRPAAVAPIDPTEWRAALGQHDRFEDWSHAFEQRFAQEGWRTTLDRWANRLAPGFTTAACHGAIRTAHAVRALGRNEGAVERRELADALASWASMYLPLPVEAKPPCHALDPASALARLSPVPADHRAGEGLIVAGYLALVHAPDFCDEVAAVDLRGDIQERVDDLVVLFADLFVRRAQTPFLAIVFAHAVTAAAAVGHIASAVSETSARALLYRAWEAGCALAAAFGEDAADSASAARTLDPEDLRRAAVANGDDHVIKLSEACLATWTRRPVPVLLEAAAHIQRVQ